MRRFEVTPPDTPIPTIFECLKILGNKTACTGYGGKGLTLDCCKWCRYYISEIEKVDE